MILHLRNILSLNEKFAYSLIGKLRYIILPIFNSFLKFQLKVVHSIIKNNLLDVRKRLLKILPGVNNLELIEVLSIEEKRYVIAQANKILQHEFEILSVKVKFEQVIDWHLDFNSGFKW